MFSIKINISEVKAKTRSLDSRSFCVCVNAFEFCFHLKILFYCFYDLFAFTAYTGGILGLFMGFSVFSIVEIFYFLTFRPFIHLIKGCRKHRQTAPMNKNVKRLHRNHLTKSLRLPRTHWNVIDNNTVYPYTE